MGYQQEIFGVNRWWRHVEITTNTNTTLLADPVDADAQNLQLRPVIEGWHIQSALSTTTCNASIRSKTTTTTIAVRVDQPGGAAIEATSEAGNVCIPMAANEGLIVNTAGITGGRVNVTCWGRWVPTNIALADKYTGAP